MAWTGTDLLFLYDDDDYSGNDDNNSNNNHGKVEKQYVLHVLSVYAALVIQHAMRMCCVTFSFVACPDIRHFSTLSHKWQNF
jgi:hypothetical protein